MKLYIYAFLAGLSYFLGFAPYGLYPVPLIALIALFLLWQHVNHAKTAAKLGFAFGLGLFGAGIGWVYIAMHDYGGMAVPVAALATLLFVAHWALFPALAGYIQARLPAGKTIRLVLIMPAIWCLCEWLRGMIYTGFPWLVAGYAHSDSPLAGYAPLLGVYGLSLITALCAGLLAASWKCRHRRWLILATLILWLAGAALRTIHWTQPTGQPITVALIQGNIAQDLKFRRETLLDTIILYQSLAQLHPAQLTILPETALPLLRQEIPPDILQTFQQHAQAQHGDLLIGSFSQQNGQFYNSVFSTGNSPEQAYRKQHLVPFGEFIPLRPMFATLINDILQIPMSDLGRGGEQQPPLQLAGQKVAVSICYEDVFGEELIRNVPQATLLVNVTNDAWYGHSPAAAQHNQIAQLRALESGRMMLRATNTGVTSIISAQGKIEQQLPQHQQGALTGSAQGYTGLTPYVRWGNSVFIGLLLMMLIGAYAWRSAKRLRQGSL